MARGHLSGGKSVNLTTAQIPAASAGLKGLTVFDTTTLTTKICDGTNWHEVGQQPGAAAMNRANVNISGGGSVAYSGGSFYWTSRFIVIANGNGTNFSTAGYFDITVPANGTTITGTGGAANQTVASGGIPVGVWTALYYILPIGSGSGSVAANFRLVTYSGALDVPAHWVLLAVQNGDDSTLKVPAISASLKAGESAVSGRSASAANLATASLPASSAALKGTIMFDTTTNTLKYCNGTAWVEPAAATDATTSAKGIVQLAGDLAGTAAAPKLRVPFCQSSKTTQVIANNSFTTVDVDTTNADNGVTLDGTAMSDLTNNRIYARRAGLFLCFVAGQWDANGTGYRQIQLVVNGFGQGAHVDAGFSGYFGSLFSVTVPMLLSSGDYMTGTAYQGSGGNLNLTGATLKMIYMGTAS